MGQRNEYGVAFDVYSAYLYGGHLLHALVLSPDPTPLVTHTYNKKKHFAHDVTHLVTRIVLYAVVSTFSMSYVRHRLALPIHLSLQQVVHCRLPVCCLRQACTLTSALLRVHIIV